MDDPSQGRFQILTCIDGSDESYRGLRYATRIGSGIDADITLLYVRARESAISTGGLDSRVVHENLLEWELELPGVKYLRAARDILIEAGFLGEGWSPNAYHTDRSGDAMGDNSVQYAGPSGKKIAMHLRVADDIVQGILDECEAGGYSLVILGASERWRPGRRKTFWDPAVAEKIVARAPCSVLVARELEQNHGHLICTSGSEASIDMARKDAILASRCNCPIAVLSVAPSEEAREEAEEAVRRTCAAIEELGVPVMKTCVRIGKPVSKIIEAGVAYSVIVVAHSAKSGLRWLFDNDIAFQVVEQAHNSVMVVK